MFLSKGHAHTVYWETLGYVIRLFDVDNIKRVNIGAAEAVVVPLPSLQMQIFICKSL